MSDSTEQRKLAAIMFTDMVGYSALSQRNEKLAQELLEEHRALLRPLFPRFNGTEIKTIGDAFLVEFYSALEAAQCGIEIQRALAHRNHDVAAERRIEIKIGIHIGDVVHRGGDVYGDGVNIASRIEPLAGAGGICVSMDVERQIRNALEARFEKLAPTELKNISVTMDLFRIVLPWEEAKAEGKRQKEKTGAEVGRGVPPNRTGLLKLAAVAVAVVVLAVGLGWWFTRPNGNSTAPTNAAPVAVRSAVSGRITSLAVKPLDDFSGDTNQAFFSDGMTEALCATLGNISALSVRGRSSVMRYKNSPKSIPEMAKELNVDAILEGSVQRLTNRMLVTVQLVEAATDRHVWATNYNRDLSDFFAVQNELALAIANEIKIQISPEERARLTKTRPVPAAAQEAYLKGRFFWSERNASSLANASAYFKEAIRIDPNYAAAYAGLADVRVVSIAYADANIKEAYTKAKIEVQKALALDDTQAEAHAGLANIKMGFDWDFAGAEAEFKRAIALNPSYAPAHYWYALGLVAAKRDSEAEAEAQRAVEVDPLSGIAHLHRGWIEYYCRRHDQSLAAFEQALVLNPGLNVKARVWMGWIYDQKGMPEKAFATWQAMFAALGRSAEEAAAREKDFKASGIAGYWANRENEWNLSGIALIYANAGKKKEALELLEKCYQEKEVGIYYWLRDPAFDDLRSEPRFMELIRKIGFEK
ncbi:MAG: hypothetical protein HY043_14995 [Verrucomicrobia bacterium]|nr:hypothetical protein [Verrucomicrobiota bacterium]